MLKVTGTRHRCRRKVENGSQDDLATGIPGQSEYFRKDPRGSRQTVKPYQNSPAKRDAFVAD